MGKSKENMYLRIFICHFSTPMQTYQDLQVVESNIYIVSYQHISLEFCMMTNNILVCTLFCWKKINQTIHFSLRNTCMKYKFGNFTYEHFLKGELIIIFHIFKFLWYHVHEGHDELIFNIL